MNPARLQERDGGNSVSPRLTGELTVWSPQSGSSFYPLHYPLTLIGSGDHCHVRLREGELPATHSAIYVGPEGLMVCSLQSDRPVCLNGRAVWCHAVQSGDILQIGGAERRTSITLRLNDVGQLGPPERTLDRGATGTHTVQTDPNNPALRVQVAALAAQSAALLHTEDELRRQTDSLDLQQRQLSNHLDEQQRQLIEFTERCQQARRELAEERQVHMREIAAERLRIGTMREEAEAAQQELRLGRRRLLRLRRRLRHRHHQHWLDAHSAMRERATALAEQRRQLDLEAQKLCAQRQSLAEAVLRFNGDSELAKRQLQESRDKLAACRMEWHAKKQREQQKFNDQAQLLQRRAADLLAAEKVLMNEREQWAHLRLSLLQEADGLETRIENQRKKLAVLSDADQAGVQTLDQGVCVKARGASEDSLSLHREFALQAGVSAPLRSAGDANNQQISLGQLESVARKLGDEQLRIIEMHQQFALSRRQWEIERDDTIAELQSLRRMLEEGGRDVYERAQKCRRLDAEVVQRQQQLDAAYARFRVQVSAWQSGRAEEEARSRAKHTALEQQAALWKNIRRRWERRRQEEISRLRLDHALCAEVHKECVGQQRDWLRRMAALSDKERLFACKVLSLEQCRQEFLVQSSDPASAERRLRVLENEHVNALQDYRLELQEVCETIQNGLEKTSERHMRLHQFAEEIAKRSANLARGETDWDYELALSAGLAADIRQELHILRHYRSAAEEQIRQLREEVERLALALIHSEPADSSLRTRAA